MRSASAAAAVVATTIVSGGAADAGAEPHLRSVTALVTNAASQLAMIQSRWSPPPDSDRPAVRAELQSIIASCEQVHATAEALLLTLER